MAFHVLARYLRLSVFQRTLKPGSGYSSPNEEALVEGKNLSATYFLKNEFASNLFLSLS